MIQRTQSLIFCWLFRSSWDTHISILSSYTSNINIFVSFLIFILKTIIIISFVSSSIGSCIINSKKCLNFLFKPSYIFQNFPCLFILTFYLLNFTLIYFFILIYCLEWFFLYFFNQSIKYTFNLFHIFKNFLFKELFSVLYSF